MNKIKELESVNKSFLWEYKNDKLFIQQSLKASNNRVVFTKDELEMIINYIGDEGFAYIADDVGEIVSGREKNGIGLFVYEKIDKDLNRIKYMRQLVAVLMEQDIIEYYGHSRDLTFALKRPDYIKNLVVKKK